MSSPSGGWAIGSSWTRSPPGNTALVGATGPPARSRGPEPGLTGLDGDRHRAPGRVVRRVGARDPTAAGIPATQRVEMEPRLAGLSEATATRRTGDGGARAVTHRERAVEIGSGPVEHRDHLVTRRGGGAAHGRSRETFPHHGAERRPHRSAPSAAGRDRLGCGSVSRGTSRTDLTRHPYGPAAGGPYGGPSDRRRHLGQRGGAVAPSIGAAAGPPDG